MAILFRTTLTRCSGAQVDTRNLHIQNDHLVTRMAPREPTRAQLSSKLAYQQHTPKFLLKLQNRMNGIPDEEELEDNKNYEDDEFEYVGSGRPPIPKRPAIPERPKDDPGSEDEDDRDEKPQVVVLKAGKHLTEREAENVRRKGQSRVVWSSGIRCSRYFMKLRCFVIEKGLPPIPEPKEDNATADSTQSSSKEPTTSSKSSASQGLSFSSSSKPSIKSNKRKLDELRDGVMKASSDDKAKSKNPQKGGGSASVKKAKKSNKTQLLSFGDDT